MSIVSWVQMKSKYPNEWLLITDFELDESGHLINGHVERHAKDKAQVYQLPSLGKSTAFRYTGESTFSGLRQHANNQNDF